MYILAIVLKHFIPVSAVEKLPFEQLNSNDGKDELEKNENDQNIEDIFQRVHNTIENGLKYP